MKRKLTLAQKYPPSPSCNCDICTGYCKRPGWWSVKEAAAAIRAGYAQRMMLEMAPELTFGVLSPAFKGCEGGIALNIHADRGCNFLKNNLCELYDTGFMPLECRFCHHEHAGLGQQCHLDLEKDWHTPEGQNLIKEWGKQIGLWERLKEFQLPKKMRSW
jgi:hypothetical protein